MPLLLLLAFNTQLRVRQGFQARRGDIVPAVVAFTVRTVVDSLQRGFNLFESASHALQEGSLAVTGKVFLHQAVLSALLASQIPVERLRILPPSYIYPYNLHADVPPERKAQSLEELVCIYHEGRSLDPEKMLDIEASDSLKAWLSSAGKLRFT